MYISGTLQNIFMNAVFPAVIMDQLERRKALVSWERCRIWVSSYPGSHTSVCFLPVLVLQATNTGVRRPGYEARIWAHSYRQLVLIFSQPASWLKAPLQITLVGIRWVAVTFMFHDPECDHGPGLGMWSLPCFGNVVTSEHHKNTKNRTQPKALAFGQNSTCSKMDIIWMLYSCWSQWCKSQLHISFLAQDT